jgi:hypothetical protein
MSLFGLDYHKILSKQQIRNLRLAEEVGKSYQIKGFGNLAKTLPAIVLTESSGGKFMIGDSYFKNRVEKNFLLRSMGLCHTRLETAYETISKTRLKYKYSRFLHKDQFAFKKYTKILSRISYNQIKCNKKKLIKLNKEMDKYELMYHTDTEVAQKLLLDKRFNLEISMEYFIRNYNIAKSRGYKNPYRCALSMHNGGWNNKVYLSAIRKNMKYLQRIHFY